MRATAALVFCLCVSAFAQKEEYAQASYSQNGVLIGLANLAPLRDCSVRAMEGKVRGVKVDEGKVHFEMKKDEERMAFSFPLDRLDPAERKIFRKDFLHKGLKLRATGYACGNADEPLETIGIERLYK